jgi:WD40 repeat protein
MKPLLPAIRVASRTSLAIASGAARRSDSEAGVARHWVKPKLGQVTSLDYAAALLAAAGAQVCCVWDTRTGALARRIVEPAPIRCISLSRDGALLALGTGSSVRLYRMQTGELAFEYRHAGLVTSVHIAWRSAHLASADDRGNVDLRDLQGSRLWRHARRRRADLVVFVEQHSRFVSVESREDVKFFDLGSGERTRSFSHRSAPRRGGPHPCTGQLLIAYSGSTVRLFDCGSESRACFTAIDFGSDVTGIDISADQSVFLVAARDRMISFHSMASGRQLWTHETFTTPLLGARFGPGDSVYAAGGEGLVMELSRGQHVRSYYDESAPIVSAALDPQRRALLVSDRDGGVVHYDLGSGRRSDRFAGHAGSVSVVTCNDELVASGAYDGTCRVRRWDGSPVAVFDLRGGPVQSLALGRSSTRIWIGTMSGAVSCFCLESSERVAGWTDRSVSVRSLGLSGDGGLLVAGDGGGLLTVRDLAGGCSVVMRTRLPGCLYRCRFDGDLSILVSTHAGVSRVEVATGRELALYPGEEIRWFCLLDDGRLCSLELAGTLRIFDMASGECVRSVRIGDPRVHRVVLALGPDRIATGSADGIVRFFDYNLALVAELHHLRSGLLWTTNGADAPPGWLFCDRPELLDVGEARDDKRVAWPASDSRRLAHLTVYNSATHVMESVCGRTADGIDPAGMACGLPTIAYGLQRLAFDRPQPASDRTAA